jgi:hypothetical protein
MPITPAAAATAVQYSAASGGVVGFGNAGVPPPAQLALTAGEASATVGVQATGWSVGNIGTVPALWAVAATPGEVAFLSSSGTLAAGATVNIGPMAMLAGLKSIMLTSGTAGAIIIGSPAPLTGVAAPPPSPPTTATLSGATTAVAAAAQTYTVTLNAAADQTYTITWSVTGGTPASGTSTITSGNTSASVGVTFPSAGAASVDFTVSPSLTRAGRPITVTVSGAAPPPPPVAPSGAILLRPMSTWAGSQPWTTGHVFAPGEIASAETVGAAGATVQVDVRTRYADGSLRFAVLSGITTQADIPLLRNGTPASGTAVAEPTIAATVAFTSVVDAASATVAGGSFTADIATARTAGITAWDRTTARKVRQILGPVMSEFHYFVPTPDAHTHVWFYVRAYSSGAVEVETVVENGWLQVASPGRRTYDVTVTVGGTSRYTGTGLVHYHHTRWSRVDWVGTAPTALMAQSTAHLQTTGAVPSYATLTPASGAYTTRPEYGTKHASYTSAEALRPAPFALANIDPSLGSGGDTDMYGIVPGWAATYLVGQNPGAHLACLANGPAMGRFSVHYRDETDGRPHRGSVHTTLGLNNTTPGVNDVSGSNPTLTPAPAGGVNTPEWKYTHSPAAYFTAAILSGRWSMIEGVQFVAATGELTQSGNTGAFRGIGWWDQNRGQGWKFRDRVQAELVTASHLAGTALSAGADLNQRLEAVGRVEQVVNDWHDWYVSGSATGQQTSARGNVFGLPYQNADFQLTDANNNEGEHAYGGLMTAIYILCALYGFDAQPALAGTQRTRLQALAEHFGKWPIGMLGANPAQTTWNWRIATFVALGFGTPGATSAGGDASTTTYRATWDAQWSAMEANHPWVSGTWPVTAATNNLRKIEYDNVSALRMRELTSFGADTDVSTFFWAAHYAHKVADRASLAGADLAIGRLLGSGTWANGLGSLMLTRPEFAVQSDRVLPSWRPASGELVNLFATGALTNTFESQRPPIDVGPDASGYPFLIDAYSGAIWNPYYKAGAYRYGALVIHGGGHGNYFGNETVVLKVGNTLAFERLDTPTFPLTVGDSEWAEHADGRPYSAHTYDLLAIQPPSAGGGTLGSLIRPLSQAAGGGAWLVPAGAPASRNDALNVGRSHRFELATKAWSRFSTNTFNSGTLGGYPSGNLWEGPAGASVWDNTLQRWWITANGASGSDAFIYWLDTSGTYGRTAAANGGAAFTVDTVTMRLVETGGLRLLILGGLNPAGTAVKLVYLDLANIAAGYQGVTLGSSIAATYHVGFDWVPDISRLIVFSGANLSGCYEVQIPATLSDTWAVTPRTYPGGATMVAPSSSYAKKLNWIPEARCFLILPRAANGSACNVYAYTPVGA